MKEYIHNNKTIITTSIISVAIIITFLFCINNHQMENNTKDSIFNYKRNEVSIKKDNFILTNKIKINLCKADALTFSYKPMIVDTDNLETLYSMTNTDVNIKSILSFRKLLTIIHQNFNYVMFLKKNTTGITINGEYYTKQDIHLTYFENKIYLTKVPFIEIKSDSKRGETTTVPLFSKKTKILADVNNIADDIINATVKSKFDGKFTVNNETITFKNFFKESIRDYSGNETELAIDVFSDLVRVEGFGLKDGKYFYLDKGKVKIKKNNDYAVKLYNALMINPNIKNHFTKGVKEQVLTSLVSSNYFDITGNDYKADSIITTLNTALKLLPEYKTSNEISIAKVTAALPKVKKGLSNALTLIYNSNLNHKTQLEQVGYKVPTKKDINLYGNLLMNSTDIGLGRLGAFNGIEYDKNSDDEILLSSNFEFNNSIRDINIIRNLYFQIENLLRNNLFEEFKEKKGTLGYQFYKGKELFNKIKDMESDNKITTFKKIKLINMLAGKIHIFDDINYNRISFEEDVDSSIINLREAIIIKPIQGMVGEQFIMDSQISSSPYENVADAFVKSGG